MRGSQFCNSARREDKIGMFGFGKNRFLGVDIGASSIKVVEIKVSNNKPSLSNYAWMNITHGEETQEDYFNNNLAWYLKRLLREGNFKSTKANTAIPAFGGLVTLIELPEMDKEDIEQAIRFEAHRYIPTSLDEVTISWDIVNKKNADKPLIATKENAEEKINGSAPSSSKLNVLLVAAPKSKVENYEKLIKGAGLELNSIEIESFSILRSLVGNDPGNFIIIDIGARVCNIILVEKGIIRINRNIDAGGRDITKTIARSMNVDEVRAEKFKASGKELLKNEAGIKFPTLEIIVSEIKRVLSAYYKNEGCQKVDGIILSGGTAGLAGIDRYFSEALKIKTIIGNPFGRIEYDKKLEDKLMEMKSRFSVSVGLALRGAEEYAKK